jgi:hypothetical protein
MGCQLLATCNHMVCLTDCRIRQGGVFLVYDFADCTVPCEYSV